MYLIELLLLSDSLSIRLSNNLQQLPLLSLLRLNVCLALLRLLFEAVQLGLEVFFVLLYTLMLKVLLEEGILLGLNLLLQLIDLMVHDLQLPLHLSNLILNLIEQTFLNDLFIIILIHFVWFFFKLKALVQHFLRLGDQPFL